LPIPLVYRVGALFHAREHFRSSSFRRVRTSRFPRRDASGKRRFWPDRRSFLVGTPTSPASRSLGMGLRTGHETPLCSRTRTTAGSIHRQYIEHDRSRHAGIRNGRRLGAIPPRRLRFDCISNSFCTTRRREQVRILERCVGRLGPGGHTSHNRLVLLHERRSIARGWRAHRGVPTRGRLPSGAGKMLGEDLSAGRVSSPMP